MYKKGFNAINQNNNKNSKLKINHILKTLIVSFIAICTFSCTNNSSSSISSEEFDQDEIFLKPVSDELMSFYKEKASMSMNCDISSGLSVSSLYHLCKEDQDSFIDFKKWAGDWFLAAKDKSVHCYYVTSDVYKITDSILKQYDHIDVILPTRGLTAFMYAVRSNLLDETLKNQPIMELELNTDAEFVKTRINDYCLLDMIRLFSELELGERYIEFVDYEGKNEQAVFDKGNLKDNRRFYSQYGIQWGKLGNYDYSKSINFIDSLDWEAIEILNDNNVEVVKDSLSYFHRRIEEDPTYYDEIDACIIEKEYDFSTNAFDIYNATFDYAKLAKLLGLYEGDE